MSKQSYLPPMRGLLTKPLSSALLVFTVFAAAGCAVADTPPTARIAQFSGDRAAAISYTFDDGLRDQYTVAVPMLNEVGLKGTFFVIPNSTPETLEDAEKNDAKKRAWGGVTWSELKEMAGQGHEIASHTWSHPNLEKLPQRNSTLNSVRRMTRLRRTSASHR